jgi:hypothetical protein
LSGKPPQDKKAPDKPVNERRQDKRRDPPLELRSDQPHPDAERIYGERKGADAQNDLVCVHLPKPLCPNMNRHQWDPYRYGYQQMQEHEA